MRTFFAGACGDGQSTENFAEKPTDSCPQPQTESKEYHEIRDVFLTGVTALFDSEATKRIAVEVQHLNLQSQQLFLAYVFFFTRWDK